MTALLISASVMFLAGIAALVIPSAWFQRTVPKIINMPGIIWLAAVVRLAIGLSILLSVPRWSVAEFIGWLALISAFVPIGLGRSGLEKLFNAVGSRTGIVRVAGTVTGTAGAYLLVISQTL